VLCYVTDRQTLAVERADRKAALLEKIEQAANAGVDSIELREKDLTGRELTALAVLVLRRGGNTPRLLINDRLDVAIATSAAGVHLSEHSLPVREAKRLLTERCAGNRLLVGRSTHSLHAAEEAEAAGADYVFFGPVYATPSKQSFGAPQGIERLREVSRCLSIPVIAIGGITLENAAGCLGAGASGIAAIRLFQHARNLREVVAQLRDAI